MTTVTKITAEMCVHALFKLELENAKAITARDIAGKIKDEYGVGTTSRAVATAMRGPLERGEVWFGNWVRGVATYKRVSKVGGKK